MKKKRLIILIAAVVLILFVLVVLLVNNNKKETDNKSTTMPIINGNLDNGNYQDLLNIDFEYKINNNNLDYSYTISCKDSNTYISDLVLDAKVVIPIWLSDSGTDTGFVKDDVNNIQKQDDGTYIIKGSYTSERNIAKVIDKKNQLRISRIDGIIMSKDVEVTSQSLDTITEATTATVYTVE